MPRKTTDITVHTLNLDTLAPLDKVREALDDNEITGVRFSSMGVVLRDGSPYALLDTDGCGYMLGDDEKVYFDFWAQWPKSQSMFPSGQVGVARDELHTLFGEEKNLAEFIRTFGSRLEANYEMWRRELGA